jgi:DNA-binding transcriptional ArsR family regulator
MKEQKEQISEEFARNIIESIFIGYSKDTIDYWIKCFKQKGYIKQSREEKIRGELKELDDGNIPFPNYEYYYFKAIELIEILDNKE